MVIRQVTGQLEVGGAASHERHRLLQAVLDGTTDAVFVKDLAGRYLIINAAGASYVGRPAQQIIGKRDCELFPPPVARQIMEHDRLVMGADRARGPGDGAAGPRQQFEVSMPVAGELRVFLSTKTPYRDGRGKVVGLTGISRDITQRKRAEQALRESEERLARILESAMDAIVTIDAGRKVRLFNSAAEDVFGCPAAEALGRRFDRFAPAALREVVQRCLKACGRPGSGKRYMWLPEGLSARRADGRQFPIEATISPVEAGGQRLLTLILRDVNERQKAERELRRLKLQNLYLHEEVRAGSGSELLGRSAAARRILQTVEQVAATDSTVLVSGETGTGKELVARAIHARSARRDSVLVKVNCAALPGGLVESELFGHEQGAFTGALARRIGRFEMADGGTIFLDEIGDLPLELQAKLLRVLQEGEFERLGGTETLKVNVRVIAATNRELHSAVQQRRFRADLYYRLNVFPIRIPPLRERRADIPLLARHFVLHYAAKMGKRLDRIPGPALRALGAYDWPGNVRELQNVIERAVILSRGGRLEVGEWPPAPADAAPARGMLTLAQSERQHILKTLELTNWRVSGAAGAAAVLGLKPTTLESRMKKLGIVRRG